MPPSRFRLLTFNTWKNDGNLPKRLPLIVEGLRAARADVLCLQEIFSLADGSQNTADFLAAELGYRCMQTPARRKQRLHGGQMVDTCSGMALLTNLPVRNWEVLSLPTDPQDGERIAQMFELEIAGERLHVCNLHLTYLPEAFRVRQAQLHQVLEALQQRLCTDAILAGDFNETRDGPLFSWLRPATGNHWQEHVPVAELWQKLPVETQTGPGRTGPLDHVVYLAAQPRWQLEHCQYLFAEPAADSQIFASDHLGVLTEWRQKSQL